MSPGRMALRWMVLVATVAPATVAAAQLPAFLELRVPKPPTVATAEGGSFLAYELHVTNFMAQQITLRKLDVVTAGSDHRVLLSLNRNTAQTLRLDVPQDAVRLAKDPTP